MNWLERKADREWCNRDMDEVERIGHGFVVWGCVGGLIWLVVAAMVGWL